MINSVLLTLWVSFVIQILFFIFAAIFKTDKVTDLAYGLTFVILSWLLFFYTGGYSTIDFVVVALISFWGLRLSSYLFIRIMKIKKDDRFDGIRENLLKFAGFWFLQAISITVIMLPVTVLLSIQKSSSWSWFVMLGLLGWVKGFIIQSVADAQKFSFKNRHPDRFMSKGLWKYSRHPNYYGEILMWWGIFMIAINYISGWQWISVLGPIWITFLLLFVTGIPTVEKKADKKYGSNKKYREYKNNTSILIPWIPKK